MQVWLVWLLPALLGMRARCHSSVCRFKVSALAYLRLPGMRSASSFAYSATCRPQREEVGEPPSLGLLLLWEV